MSSIPFPEIKAAFDDDPFSLLEKTPGLWLVDKPAGYTSHDVVAKMRRFLKMKRVGHAGTLDPMASGLLIIMAGNASRLFDSLQAFPKTYRAGFLLGARTDSQDATGRPLADWVPERRPPIPESELARLLPDFTGEIVQIPPMYSALKKNGVPLYKLARRGEEVERAPRPATCYSLVLETFDGESGELTATVASGFYVRTLIDDLGERLGCGAVMTSLRREGIGPFTLERAATLKALQDKLTVALS